mgnify:CR=1 FL=1|jgi:hypothetical protein
MPRFADRDVRHLIAAESRQRLEDLYLPYKPKRRSKAQMAREAGLAPLAELLLTAPTRSPEAEAACYQNPDAGFADTRSVLDGARQILMERFAEDPDLLAQRHRVERISIGNGTASRETDLLVAELIRQHPALHLRKVGAAARQCLGPQRVTGRSRPDPEKNRAQHAPRRRGSGYRQASGPDASRTSLAAPAEAASRAGRRHGRCSRPTETIARRRVVATASTQHPICPLNDSAGSACCWRPRQGRWTGAWQDGPCHGTPGPTNGEFGSLVEERPRYRGREANDLQSPAVSRRTPAIWAIPEG